MTLDDLRARLPNFGMALYAMDPGEPVRLEVYFSDGTIMAFTDMSASGAVAQAFEALLPAPVAPARAPQAEKRVHRGVSLYEPTAYVEDDDVDEAGAPEPEEDIFG